MEKGYASLFAESILNPTAKKRLQDKIESRNRDSYISQVQREHPPVAP